MQDLDQVIILGGQALRLGQNPHPLQGTSLNSLVGSPFIWYKQLGEIDDPEKAIELA